MMRNLAKIAFVRFGTVLPETATWTLKRAAEQMEVGRWMKQAGYKPVLWASERTGVFRAIADRVGNEKVLYLEFGVFTGGATRYWSELLKNPEAILHGFDSFEGLPNDWHRNYGRGTFDVGGKIPEIDDSRVTFFKGWFDQTMPQYTPPPHDRLIVNIDADLYSSAAYVLDMLKDTIVVGSFIYFDEFCYPEGELKAFDEFRRKNDYEFALVTSTRDYQALAFERVKL